MSTIDFVVRDDAGTLQSGSLAGANGSTSVLVAAGQDLSLNLQRGNILSYVRQGQALQITLVDGQVLTIEGFYTPSGVANADLFISANGELAKVDLVAGEGNLLYAQYLDSDSFGKWSPDDDLYFVRGSDVQVAGVVDAGNQGAEAGMLAVPLLGAIGGLGFPAAAAAGIGGALLLGGTTGGGDGTDGDVNNGGGGGATPPEVDIATGVDGSDHVVNAADHADGVEIGGTGTPGATGTVTIGDASIPITIDENGEWNVTFTPQQVEGGEYTTDVTVTVSNDGGTATSTDTLVVDTVAEVTFDAASVETDGTINLVEESDGFVLTGTTQAGSTVVVSFGGNDYNAVVTGTSWSLNVAQGVISGGEYDLNVSVTATDTHSNTATTTGTVRVDTVTTVTIDTSAVGNDGTVNAAEHAGGVTVGGQAQAGATVVVSAISGGQTVSQTVTATDSGSWTATFTSAQIAEGTYDLKFTADATDPAGNTASATGTVQVDTELTVSIETTGIEGDGVVNAVERSDGVVLTGQTEANALVEINWEGAVRTVRASGTGEWSANFPSGSVPEGTLTSQVSVKATDAAGNTATTTGSVVIDTELDVTVNTADAGGDGVVNFVERQGGLTLTGTTEAGAQVEVTFNGVSRTTAADGNGNWSADWPASAVPSGERDVAVQVKSTDDAGNVATTSGSVNIDTYVNRLEFGDQKVEGDDIVNNAEASDGLTLGGVVEAGSTISVTYTDGGGNTVTKAGSVTSGGNWTVTFTAAEIAQGSYEATVTVNATDAAGNVSQISDKFMVDTDAPNEPDIVNQTDQGVDGIVGFTMADPEGTITVHEVAENGGAASAKAINQYDQGPNENIQFNTGEGVQDGSHLIVTDSDAAGNTNSTLFVLDDQSSNDLDVADVNTTGFNIGQIELTLAEDTNLTLTTQDIKDMSDNDNRLLIKGAADDEVTLDGTATMGNLETVQGDSYRVYTLEGDDTTLLIQEGIVFSTI
jgi:hypothetical protein